MKLKRNDQFFFVQGDDTSSLQTRIFNQIYNLYQGEKSRLGFQYFSGSKIFIKYEITPSLYIHIFEQFL
jgi:hypothetical protein